MRERRYRAEDVEALAASRSGDRLPRAADPEALMPVIGSSICLIEDGRLYYRGQDAIRLSDSATLEDPARLLWPAAAEPHAAEPAPAAAALPAAGPRRRCPVLPAR